MTQKKNKPFGQRLGWKSPIDKNKKITSARLSEKRFKKLTRLNKNYAVHQASFYQRTSFHIDEIFFIRLDQDEDFWKISHQNDGKSKQKRSPCWKNLDPGGTGIVGREFSSTKREHL